MSISPADRQRLSEASERLADSGSAIVRAIEEDSYADVIKAREEAWRAYVALFTAAPTRTNEKGEREEVRA